MIMLLYFHLKVQSMILKKGRCLSSLIPGHQISALWVGEAQSNVSVFYDLGMRLNNQLSQLSISPESSTSQFSEILNAGLLLTIRYFYSQVSLL